MDKEIIFVRHGSLPEHCRHRLVGQDNTPLSEIGVAEARAIGAYLAGLRFDAVFAGTLPRVSQTLHEASVALEAAACRDPRLNEMDFGTWSMRSVQNLSAAEQGILDQWTPGNFPFAFPEGETMGAFAERTRAAWQAIVATPGERIAVFSHGGVIMTLLADLVGLDRSGAFGLWVERGGIARTQVDPATGTGRINLIGKPIDWHS